MNRRDFLLATGTAGVSLFLPKTFYPPRWSRTRWVPIWDYQIALYNSTGEVSGAGYRRAWVKLSDFDKYYDWVHSATDYVLKGTIDHPKSLAHWGKIDQVKILDRQERVAISARVRQAEIPGNIIVRYDKGDIRVTVSDLEYAKDSISPVFGRT